MVTCPQILDKEENEDGSSEHTAHPDGENEGSMYLIRLNYNRICKQLKFKTALINIS